MVFIDWLKKILGCKEEELNIEIVKLKKQIEELKLLINNNPPIVEPNKLGTITYVEVRDTLIPYCNLEQIHISDNIFGVTSVEEAKVFSNETKVQARKWIQEQHDCDEFSFALMGYWNDGLAQFCFGIAWSATHAFNIMVDDKKQVWIVEPQSNKFISIEEAKNNSLYYPLRMVLI